LQELLSGRKLRHLAVLNKSRERWLLV